MALRLTYGVRGADANDPVYDFLMITSWVLIALGLAPLYAWWRVVRAGGYFPQGLEDAMSKQAQAERERQARIILGTAETEIAAKFVEAAAPYQNNPVAVHLRAMNMLYEGLKEKGSMVIVPSTAVESMNLGALGGMAAMFQANGAAPQGPAEAP